MKKNKEQLVRDFFSTLVSNGECLTRTYLKDQEWIEKNSLNASFLIARAINRRSDLMVWMDNNPTILTIPKRIKNSSHEEPILRSLLTTSDIFQKHMLAEDLLWLKDNPREKIHWMLKVIRNREQIQEWIESYDYEVDKKITVGDIYIEDAKPLNSGVRSCWHNPNNGWISFYYIVRKNPGKEESWDCMYLHLKEGIPRHDLAVYWLVGKTDITKVTPVMRERLNQFGINMSKIEKIFQKFLKKIDTLEKVERVFGT